MSLSADPLSVRKPVTLALKYSLLPSRRSRRCRRRRQLPLHSTLSLSYFMAFFWLAVSLFAQSTIARDPVADFCRRWGHQSAVIEDRLFIDGGYVNWGPIGDNPENYTNEWFLYHDLSSSAAEGMPPMKTLTKNTTVPDVIGGALWPDTLNKRLFLFGGEVDPRSPPPTGYSLFAFDALHDYWEEIGRPDIHLNSPSFGGSVAVPERGLGFYYGGWLNNGTVPGWSGAQMATNSLIVFDMDERTWRNKTGPDNIGRAEGVMVYIPAGDNGFLVYFGGIQDQNGNETYKAQPMDEILLFDFVADKWYTEKTYGPTPDARRRFCAGAAWAQDYSSYNIYLFGGLGIPPNDTAIDDVWILTMPSFQWMKWHPEPENGPNGEHPHHSLTCNVVGGGSQMLIIGGSFPYERDCDSASHYGAHGLYLGQQNEGKRKWETYNESLQVYEVPDIIIDAVGGGRTGGATATAPSSGFANADLAVLMTRTASASTRTATRDVSINPEGNNGISTGAIIGIAVGGAAVLITGLVLGWRCLRRRFPPEEKSKDSAINYPPSSGPQPESPLSSSPYSPSTYIYHRQNSQPHMPLGPGSTHDPIELPGNANVNTGAYEITGSGSSSMPSPSPVHNIYSPDGKILPMAVAFYPHRSRGSYSSVGNESSHSPTSVSFPTGASAGINGVHHSPSGPLPSSASAKYAAHDLLSPTKSTLPPRQTTPAELSTEPRDPDEGYRSEERVHQTYYNPSYADAMGIKQ